MNELARFFFVASNEKEGARKWPVPVHVSPEMGGVAEHAWCSGDDSIAHLDLGKVQSIQRKKPASYKRRYTEVYWTTAVISSAHILV